MYSSLWIYSAIVVQLEEFLRFEKSAAADKDKDEGKDEHKDEADKDRDEGGDRDEGACARLWQSSLETGAEALLQRRNVGAQ